MALRYLAGGSALDIMYLHGVGRSTFYACLWPTLRALDLSDNLMSRQPMEALAEAIHHDSDPHKSGRTSSIVSRRSRPSSAGDRTG